MYNIYPLTGLNTITQCDTHKSRREFQQKKSPTGYKPLTFSHPVPQKKALQQFFSWGTKNIWLKFSCCVTVAHSFM